MVKSGFFNGKKSITGEYDRKYNSEDINKFLEGFVSKDGVYKFVDEQCRVTPSIGNSIIVRKGKGTINYHWFIIDANEMLHLSEPHPTLPRYDAIVMRYDKANRNIYLAIKEGDAAEHPIKPIITKGDSISELCFAFIKRIPGAIEILESDIEDTVDDPTVCGFVLALTDTTSSGITMTDRLPLPTKSEIGKIYYLIKEQKLEGKVYKPDFYRLNILSYNYKYIDVVSISDIKANMPTPSSDYLDIVFYAIDEEKFYICEHNNEYVWSELEVIEVDEFPEPTNENKNNYYLKGDEIKKVVEEGKVFTWQALGSGGGSGNFAIIQITYPEGDTISVTHNDITITSPDTSGIWLYGCEEIGEYVVKNGDFSEIVSIVSQGQIEQVYISQQIINYNMLYYLGDEFIKETGGWSPTSQEYHRGEHRYNQSYSIDVHTNGTLNFDDDMNNVFVFANLYGYLAGSNNGNASFLTRLYINNINKLDFTSSTYNKAESKKGFTIVNNIKATSIKFSAAISIYHYQIGYLYVNAASPAKNTNNISLSMTGKSEEYKCTASGTTNLYALGVFRKDDISFLSDYGTTITEILNNSYKLFLDANALRKVVINCTGDFMISALSNTNFVNAMNSSENKSILLANEHWSKFLALLTV